MKKILCFAALLGFVNLSFAQNSNPWPTTGNVGIGTATPAELLDVSSATAGVIRISSKRTQFQTNDILGKLDFYKADISTGGAGVATSIQSRSYDLGGAFDLDFVTGSVSAPVNAMTLHWNGNVGVGINNPLALFHLNGINTIANSRGNAFISTTDAAAIDAGGQLGFGGSYTGTSQTYWTAVAGRKENATDADYSGYLQFSTRKNAGNLLERMRVTSDGNLGIGTTTPGLKTHINGATGFPATTGTAQTGVLRLQGTTSNSVLDFGVNGASGSYLQATSQNALNTNYPLLLNPNGGNVGVGNTAPGSALHVGAGSTVTFYNGTGTATAAQIVNLQTSGAAMIGAGVNDGTNNYRINMFADNTNALTGVAVVGSSGNPGFVIRNTSTEYLRILGNGNVGIGTINPTDKLAVNGTIHTKEVRVDLDGWADYVFKKDYKLPTLTEVKDYIDQNHHLPDMPAEKEVMTNGLNLGAMNKVLTKKVEELTLYLIEKDQQLKSQREEIDQLKEQFREFKKSQR